MLRKLLYAFHHVLNVEDHHMSVLNETPVTTPTVWVGHNRLLYEGPLPDLQWHQHSFACVLIGLEQPIELSTRDAETQVGEVVLVPGNVSHRLRFGGGRVLSHYIAPHEADYAGLMSLNRAISPHHGCAIDATETWRLAIERWQQERDPHLLMDEIRHTWAFDGAVLDHRITRIARMLWRGEALRTGTAAVAEHIKLSPSRLSFLCQREIHGTLGQLQRGYRFWHAARAMLNAQTFTEAAHAAEFADGAHFSRAFRAAYGLAPSMVLLTQTQWVEGTTF